nr:hypothetical protein [Tanacetum cinerariifolium]
MNYYKSNPCYDSNYFGFDQIEPSQYSVNQPLNIQNELTNHELFINELIQQKLDENAQLSSAIAITLDLSTVEPKDSLRIEDEHLDTIPETKSDEFIKSSVENLIDSLLDECVGELILLKSIPPRIDETDYNPEEGIPLIEKLLYDSSSPRPPKEFISENSDATIKSFSPSPIPVEDRDVLILEELLSNDSPSLPKNKSFHFDIPSFPRPPAKPPDDDEIEPNSGIFTVKIVGDISEHYVPMPRLLPTQPTHDSN